MIHAIRSDHATFRTINLDAGFNVVLAERTKEASDKDSRNGVGKTTLLEIIHFCLGSRSDRKNRLMSERLRDWTFTIDLDLRGRRYLVHRNTSDAKRVFVEGDFSAWPVEPRLDKETGRHFLRVGEWNGILGWLLFNLPIDGDVKYAPTFRSMFSYFARRGRDAFSTPFEHHRRQSSWDVQVCNAFLMGLSWEYPSEMQRVKDEEATLKKLRSAINSGIFPELFGSVGELESILVRIEEEVARKSEELRTFRVHPQYEEYQSRADALQSSIRELNSDDSIDRAMLTFYGESLEEETPADRGKIESLYREAGLALPDNVVKRLEDVQDFHTRVVANRRAFLQSEIDRLKNATESRTQQIKAYSDARADLLAVLQTHGALGEYAGLSRLYDEDVARLEQVKQRIENLRKMQEGQSRIRIERERLQTLARADYNERRTVRTQAISLFNRFSEALYSRPGELIVDVVPSGYKLAVDIERQDSQGVEQMKVFCYDLAVACLWAKRDATPGLLIHDSTIFADVDERQKAHAIELAAEMSSGYGFQYICCLNSDSLPTRDFSEGFQLDRYIRIRLTDATEEGSLLGIRF